MKLATFGGGCFWCVETLIKRLKGVNTAQNGYMGGSTKNPTYKEICNGNPGNHAEVVQFQYDPSKVTYERLLYGFFSAHDPTQLNKQGNDVGTQYRSVIFCHDEEQRK